MKEEFREDKNIDVVGGEESISSQLTRRAFVRGAFAGSGAVLGIEAVRHIASYHRDQVNIALKAGIGDAKQEGENVTAVRQELNWRTASRKREAYVEGGLSALFLGIAAGMK